MKSILVVDMPKDCEYCDCSFDDTDYGLFCSPLKRDIFVRNEKPSWCPLKPLPKKNKYDVGKYATVDYENNVTLGHYLNKGWNDCLDAITGETE